MRRIFGGVGDGGAGRRHVAAKTRDRSGLRPSAGSARVVTRRRRMVVGLLAVTALVVAGCSNSKEEGGSTVAKAGDGSASANDAPGVSDDEIRFAAFGTQANNPLGTCVLDCYTDGINAYFAFRNSEGGVHGRDLVLSTVLDDELTKNQQRALEVLSADDTFAAFSATQVPSGWAAMAEAGVPLYTWSIHPAEATGKDSIFGYSGVLCVKCTTRAPIYAGTLVDATTVGTLGYSVSASSSDCAAGAADSVERYGPDSGQVLGYTNDDLAFGLPNGIGPEVTAMKKAGVDFVIGCLDLNGMKTLAQELERQGMEEVVMFHPNTYDESFVGEAGDLFEGDIVNVSFRPFEADPGDSLLADFQHWMKKSDREITELAMIGWINADLAYQGLVDAGEGFDRARVIAATNELTGYTAGGLIPPVDWSRQHEPPAEDDALTHGPAQQCTAFVQVEDGEFELVGDQAKPFRCWDPSDRDWAEPVETTFE